MLKKMDKLTSHKIMKFKYNCRTSLSCLQKANMWESHNDDFSKATKLKKCVCMEHLHNSQHQLQSWMKLEKHIMCESLKTSSLNNKVISVLPSYIHYFSSFLSSFLCWTDFLSTLFISWVRKRYWFKWAQIKEHGSSTRGQWWND
jgi:hypothetical protein